MNKIKQMIDFENLLENTIQLYKKHMELYECPLFNQYKIEETLIQIKENSNKVKQKYNIPIFYSNKKQSTKVIYD
jgi:hypothetical protein